MVTDNTTYLKELRRLVLVEVDRKLEFSELEDGYKGRAHVTPDILPFIQTLAFIDIAIGINSDRR